MSYVLDWLETILAVQLSAKLAVPCLLTLNPGLVI